MSSLLCSLSLKVAGVEMMEIRKDVSEGGVKSVIVIVLCVARESHFCHI